MSNADTRAEIAAAVSTLDGLTGFAERPANPKAGDAWPQWRGAERAGGFAFLETWQVVIVMPSEEVKADEWADLYGYELAQILQPVLHVTGIQPATLPVSGQNDTYALMITGVRE